MTNTTEVTDLLTTSAGKAPSDVLKLLGGTPSPPDTWKQAISLAVIVHPSEHEQLARCLAAASPWVGQILVVDTGPTPSTRIAEVVKAAGGEAVHDPWSDNFAAARNAALPHLKGDWVLTLDADEVLDVQDPAGLKASVGADHADVFGITLVDVLEQGEMHQPLHRLFRRRAPGFEYRSRVHEYVLGTRDGQMRIGGAVPGILIFHDGHTNAAAARQDKGRRNLALAQLELAERPDDPYSWYLVALGHGPAGMLSAQPLWQRLHEWCKANPLAAQFHGWVRHALVMSVAHTAAAAQAFESAGVEGPARQTWARASWLASNARSILPGFGDEDLAHLGGADLRYWSALAKHKLGDPAGAIDELRPVMGRGQGWPWFTVEGAWLGRLTLWARLQVAIGHASEAVGLARELAAQTQPGMPREAWGPELAALVEECEAAAVAQAQAARDFLMSLGQEVSA